MSCEPSVHENIQPSVRSNGDTKSKGSDDRSEECKQKRNGDTYVYQGIVKPERMVALDDYESTDYILGVGTFGKVILYQHKTTNQYCAVKALRIERIVAKGHQHLFEAEKSVLDLISMAGNKFLVNSFGWCRTKNHVCFVMEFIPCGNLMNHVRLKRFSEKRAVFYAACVVLGLQFLHENNIIHRDLKLNNILMDETGYVKIADMGLCKQLASHDGRTSGMCGTVNSMAPELFEGARYSKEVDWWALGVVIYEMRMRQTPFRRNSRSATALAIQNDEPIYHWRLSFESVFLLRKLLQKDPRKRLGFQKNGTELVKKQLFFQNVNWDALQQRKLMPPYFPDFNTLEKIRKVQYEPVDFSSIKRSASLKGNIKKVFKRNSCA